MRELLETVRKWQAEGTLGVLVRAVDVQGFGAGQYGNAQVVAEAGTRSGTVFRGVSDTEIDRGVSAALNAGTPQVLQLTVSEPDAIASGLSCGGRATMIVEPLALVSAMLWEAVASGQTFVLATRLDPAATMLICAEGIGGSLGDDALQTRAEELGRTLLGESRQSRVVEGDLFLERIAPRTRIVTVGGGEVVQALLDVGASLGWLVERSADEEAIDLVESLGGADALVVTSHHPSLGPAALAAGLASNAFFVGALGSRRTQQRRAETLAGLGISADDIARIHGPVGLDLGGQTPAESALAIAAEILAVRSGRNITGLRDGTGPINS